VLPQVTELRRIALDLIFPRHCVGCNKEGTFLCDSCYRSLTRILPPLCPRCGRPQPSGILCSSCIHWPAEIDGIRSPFRFEGVMRHAIHQLKYQNLRGLVVPLAELLRDYLISSPMPGEVLVPVPLHQKRMKERAYNQAGLLTRKLGKLIKLPVVDNCLVRRRHTPPQARASNVTERRSNIANAFTCRDNRLENKQVLIIDDVTTSGATLDACAVALKATGVTSVWGLVMARDI
jgi:competence protein ComFC